MNYDILEEFYKLEKQNKERELNPEELRRYHQLSSSIPLLSLDDIMGYGDYLEREFDERLEEANEGNPLKKCIRNLAQKVLDKREEIQELKRELEQQNKFLKKELLRELEQRCSYSAYQEVRAIIERHFNNPSQNKVH